MSVLSPRVVAQIPGYEVGPLLNAGPRFLVFRGVERATGRAAVLKVNRDPYPSDRDLAAQQRAYDIARELSCEVVVSHLALLAFGHGQALVTEDFGAESLDRLLRERGALAQAFALEIGVALAHALAELHRRGVVHKDIKPANLLWSTEGHLLKLSDLEACSRLRQESLQGDPEAVVPGTPTYVAPEQTGRMNRSVDLRADLYSAGVVLYELLAGAPPFESDDPKELIHAHLARQPPDLATRCPDLHPCLPDIVHTLLQKNPEDRYGDADGLAHDLQRCLDELNAGTLTRFPLASRDHSGRFALPDRLYGREAETLALVEAVDACGTGKRQCLLVAGYSGVGKSALIAEVRLPIAARRGWFCPGKFDQFRRDLPYLAWQEALASLTRQVLALPDDRLSALRAELEHGLAGNQALIADLVPGAAALLGDCAAPPEVGPAEAQARFDQAFRAFVRILARDEHPLVLFVDDLQWADLASLQLFESLVSDPAPAHLLVLGAYRDNEVGAGHPLMASLGRLEALGKSPAVLSLPPLAPDDVHALVADTLHVGRDPVAELAALINGKTGGNPFFVRQFLGRLAAEDLVTFDATARSWRWDLSAIERQGYTDNVVEFMSGRLLELPVKTVRMLQLGACLGAVFDLHGVARIAEQSIAEVSADLEPALVAGLLLPLGSDYKLAVTDARLAEQDGRAPSINPDYAFLHDRVQQSAHESIASDDRAQIHLGIARALLSEVAPEGEQDARHGPALEVVEHLAEALDRVTDPQEQLAFARVCLLAGQQAKTSMATGPALRSLEMGRALLPSEAWQREPDLTLALYLESADACYIAERYREAEALAGTVLERTGDLDLRVRAHNILIGIGVAERRYVEATMLGVEVLAKELGVYLPRNPGMPRVLLGVLRTRAALMGRTPEALLALPTMEDPRARAAIAILMKSATNAYWGVPNLVPLIAARMVRLSLLRGNIGLSAYGYCLFGMIITNAIEAVDAGYALGKLAMDLLDRTGDRHLIGKTGLLWHGYIRHAKDPLRLCAAATLDCYDHALDAGDVENAVYCGTVAYFSDLLAGRPLPWIAKRYRDHLPALLGSSQAQTVFALRVWMQAAANLADDSRVESKTIGDLVDWPARLAEMLEDPGANMAIATVSGGAGWLAFLLDDWIEAERQFALLYARADAALGQAFWRPCMGLYGILLARKLGRGEGNAADRLRLARIQGWVRRWARRNPHDYAPYALVLEAEHAARRGRTERELARWDGAAARAHDSGNLFLDAWVNEQAAHAHGRAGHREQAHDLFERAHGLWERHGAGARLRLSSTKVTMPSSATLVSGFGATDFDAVLSAVRAVSESIEVDALAARTLEIALVQSGARRGTLLLMEHAGLRPLAAAVVDDQGRFRHTPDVPSLDPAHVPLSLLDYVTRTRVLITVDDAVTHEWLFRDPYVAKFDCLSLMGVPLLRHGRLVGMVLLENELGAGVFSDIQANLVEAIAGQVAVSLENARLFEAQRRQSDAFARFVPRPFLEHLGHRNIEDIRLGEGVQRQVTVMFTDLRGFTTLCERLAAHDTFALVNSILARMGPALASEGGFIDEFTGDGVKALFIDRADGAVRAGIAMQQRLRQYCAERAARGREPLAMGIGVHTGSVMLGTIGAEGRMSTTVLGDTVNTTARLEGLTKVYDTPFLISEQTRSELADPMAYGLRTVGRVRFKGRQQAITVHEVVDAREPAQQDALRPMISMFNEAMAAYFERRFDDAVRGFAECIDLAPDDRLAWEYRDWARRCSAEGVADDWDGVMVRAEK